MKKRIRNSLIGAAMLAWIPMGAASAAVVFDSKFDFLAPDGVDYVFETVITDVAGGFNDITTISTGGKVIETFDPTFTLPSSTGGGVGVVTSGAVPEASTDIMIALGVTCLIGAGYRRRRRG